jgi:F0F1-type ATP synthase delta subunit
MYLKKCLLFNKKYEFDLQNVAKKYRKLYEKKGQEFTIKILSQPGIYEKCQ